MKVNFNDSEYIEIVSTRKGVTESLYDRAFKVVLCSDVSVSAKEIWIDGYELENFVNDLEKLQLNLKGEASLTSESPGELLICLKPVDNLGHFVCIVEVGSQIYIGNETFWKKGSTSFSFATEELTEICLQMTSYFRGIIDA